MGAYRKLAAITIFSPPSPFSFSSSSLRTIGPGRGTAPGVRTTVVLGVFVDCGSYFVPVPLEGVRGGGDVEGTIHVSQRRSSTVRAQASAFNRLSFPSGTWCFLRDGGLFLSLLIARGNSFSTACEGGSTSPVGDGVGGACVYGGWTRVRFRWGVPV